MIIDLVENIKHYSYLGDKFQKAFTFITDPELMLLDDGKYEIDGENVYAVISQYKTRNSDEAKLEAHRKFIDVQFVPKGNELIGYAPFKGQEIVAEYNDEKDVILYSGDKSFFKIEPGMFAIFFPNELHMPGIKAAFPVDVKKVVIKVKA
jgi:YhcH/YjgK/YiaL family protein